MRIAFLSTFFVGEYGVTRVLAAQMPLLVAAGHQVDLYACFLDKSLVAKGVHAVRVPTHFRGLRECLRRGAYDVVVACTEQFFSLVASWKLDAVTVAYEHGYIPVELTVPAEREQHRKMIEERVKRIYPAFDYVVTISKYAVDYIRWPKAFVLYNGADHFAKALSDCSRDSAGKDCAAGLNGASGNDCSAGKECAAGLNSISGKNCAASTVPPVRVLAVCRYREVEWEGKGMDDFCRLKKDLGDRVDITVVGGGDAVTCKKLADAGVRGLGAVKDPVEMARLYEGCDVLVSFSRCEMFNLPLAEAGFAHRPALALNVCAHPEVTPFVFPGYEEIRDYIAGATAQSLRADGEKMFAFVDGKFRWEMNARRLLEFLERVSGSANSAADLSGSSAGGASGSTSRAPSSLRKKSRKPSPLFHMRWGFWQCREFVRNTLRKVAGR
ncbi:MAG: glycosyltransferase family 4 protein [Fibrobacter sp.]|uniref:glycosyltransferase family 4 protein n=1 Tax=Fibrobacter sp. TaxID=35828 RepID=UPI0025BFE35C|nr:glycosyltransferase family 4 protein [Fibrobacter sp.]MBR4785551.1 glycosyltransferase family 4 protein [Fibrobacter sp.]